MAELLPDNVGDHLRSDASRTATLNALEAIPAPVPTDLALAAAPALVDTLTGTEDRDHFDRCMLLIGRLLTQAAPDPSTVFGAAFAGERFKAVWAPRVHLVAVQRALGGHPLTRGDAYSYACLRGPLGGLFSVRGQTAPFAATGRTAMEAIADVSVCPHVLGRSDCILTMPAAVHPRSATAGDERRTDL